MARRCLLALITLLLISTFSKVARADSQPKVPMTLQPVINCIYHVMKSNSDVLSLELYAVDSVRFAIEYSFRDKDG
jgi:hypothetical protein